MSVKSNWIHDFEEEVKFDREKHAHQRAVRLADSAPEMLEALKLAIKRFDAEDYGFTRELCASIISKIEGKS